MVFQKLGAVFRDLGTDLVDDVFYLLYRGDLVVFNILPSITGRFVVMPDGFRLDVPGVVGDDLVDVQPRLLAELVCYGGGRHADLGDLVLSQSTLCSFEKLHGLLKLVEGVLSNRRACELVALLLRLVRAEGRRQEFLLLALEVHSSLLGEFLIVERLLQGRPI